MKILGEIKLEKNIAIRTETENDCKIVENLVRETFWNVYRPGAFEHYVLHCMRKDKNFLPELDFVMEIDGKIIGQNIFYPAEIISDNGKKIKILTMGPICIAKNFQRQGYGKILLDYSLEQAKNFGCGAVCFEGNINFYGKSGFKFSREFNIRYRDLPADADDSFFLCNEIISGYLEKISGEYQTPEIYFCAEKNPDDFNKFDLTFSPKEKKVLPGQIF